MVSARGAKMALLNVPNGKPLQPTKELIINLPREVILEILSHSEILGSGDILNVIRTCKALYSAISTKLLYRHIRFQLPDNEDKASTIRMQKFLKVLRYYPKRATWVHEAEFTFNADTICRSSTALPKLLSKLSSLHTLEIRTHRHRTDSEIQWDRQHRAYRSITEVNKPSSILSCLHTLPLLRSVTFYDPSWAPEQVFQLSSLSPVRQLRVTWGYGEKQPELGFLASEHQGSTQGSSSGVTKLELLTGFLPMGLPVEYVLKKFPALKELSWIMSDPGDMNKLTPTPLPRALEPLKSTLVELQLPCVDMRTVMSRKLLSFADFHVLRTLRIHSNVVLPFFMATPQDKQGEGDQDDFARRFPASLQVLEVLFNYIDWAMQRDGWEKNASSCGWLLSLASHKSIHLQRLTEVTLRLRTQLQTQDLQYARTQDLQYPRTLEMAFRGAGVVLKQRQSGVGDHDGSSYYPLPDASVGKYC